MSLKNKTILSTAWLTFGIGISQVITFVTMLVVARYVNPSEYGLYVYGIITLSFSSVIARMGLVEALVQKSDLSEYDISAAYIINIFFSLLSVVLIVLVGYIFSIVKNADNTVNLFLALSLSSFAFGLQVIPEAMLRRDMKFHVLSFSRIIGALVGSALAIFLILNDYGIWALVIQRISIEVTVTVYIWSAIKVNLKNIYFSFEKAINFLKFGISIAGFSFVELVSSNVDQFIIGAMWGDHALGLYAMAKRIVANIRQLLFLPVRQVTISAVAKIKGNLEKMVNIYCIGTRVVSLIVFPMFFVLFNNSYEIVEFMLGDRWVETGVFLQLLSVILIFDVIKIMFSSILQALDKPNWLFVERLILAVVGSVFLYFGSMTSIELGVTLLILAYAITLFVSQLMIGKLLNVSVSINIINIFPYFILAGIAVASAGALFDNYRIEMNDIVSLILEIVFSLFIYLLLCLVMTKTFKDDVSLVILPVNKRLKGKV